MHAPLWFSLVACVLAVFLQSASGRQQSDDLAATPKTAQEARQGEIAPSERGEDVAVERESHKGA